jgi:mRNA interferase MazF
MSPGEIHLAHFPFGGRVGRKLRPVLSLTGLLGPVPEVLVAFMTSIIPTSLLPTDIVLDPTQPEHASTNLKATTLVRLHKLATIHQIDVVRYLGTLSHPIQADVEARLRLLLGL